MKVNDDGLYMHQGNSPNMSPIIDSL